MSLAPCLLADIGDILEIAFIVIVFGFSALAKLLSHVQKQQVDAKGGPRPPRPRPPVDPQPARPNSLEAEIEAFLRQARGEKDGTASPPLPSPPHPSSPTPFPPGTGSRPTPPKTPATVPPPAVPASSAKVTPGEGFGRSVVTHVDEHISSGGIAARNPHLAAQTEQADERVEEHLKQVFVHDVGQLSHVKVPGEANTAAIAEGTDALTAQAVSSVAQTWRARMRNPGNVREAIILAEILKRPEI